MTNPPINPSKTGPATGPRFSLGQIVASPAALAALTAHGCSVHTLLRRHVSGDWGEALHPDDAGLND